MNDGARTMGFGSYLRAKREERQLTLLDVAERVGISVAYLSRIERERENAPKDELIQKICDVLGLAPDGAFTAAQRLPPDLRPHADQVVQMYRRSRK